MEFGLSRCKSAITGGKKARGERFDLRAFNDQVLAGGALPLAVLDRVVENWIAEQGLAP